MKTKNFSSIMIIFAPSKMDMVAKIQKYILDNPKNLGIILALISSASFGLLPAFTVPLLDDGVNNPSILFYRFSFSAFFMGSYLFIKRIPLLIKPKHLINLILIANLSYAGCSLTLLRSYAYMPTGVATTIHFLYPIIVALGMIVFFKEKSKPAIWVGMLVAIAGVALLSWNQNGEPIQAAGMGWVLTSVIFYAVYIIGVNKSNLKELNGLPLCFYVLLCCAISFAIYGFGSGQLEPIQNIKHFALFSGMALIPTLISNLCLILAIQKLGSTLTSILGCMEAITAVSVGFLYFSEAFTFRLGIGVSLILLAVSWVVYKSK